MRAREVRQRLQGHNVDPVVQAILENLAEQQHTIDKGVVDLANMVDKMMGIIVSVVGVADNMKQTIDGIRTAAGPDEH